MRTPSTSHVQRKSQQPRNSSDPLATPCEARNLMDEVAGETMSKARRRKIPSREPRALPETHPTLDSHTFCFIRPRACQRILLVITFLTVLASFSGCATTQRQNPSWNQSKHHARKVPDRGAQGSINDENQSLQQVPAATREVRILHIQEISGDHQATCTEPGRGRITGCKTPQKHTAAQELHPEPPPTFVQYRITTLREARYPSLAPCRESKFRS